MPDQYCGRKCRSNGPCPRPKHQTPSGAVGPPHREHREARQFAVIRRLPQTEEGLNADTYLIEWGDTVSQNTTAGEGPNPSKQCATVLSPTGFYLWVEGEPCPVPSGHPITYDWTMEPRTEKPPHAGNSPELDTWRDQLEKFEARVRAKQAAQPRDKTWDSVAELAAVTRKTANVNMVDSEKGLAGPDPIPPPPPSCPPSPPSSGDDEAAPQGVLRQYLQHEHYLAIQDLTALVTQSCVVKSRRDVFLLTTTRSVQSAVALVSQHVQDETLDDQSRDIFLQMVKMLPAFQDKFTTACGYHSRDSELQLRYGPVLQVCLTVDPDFRIDISTRAGNQELINP